MTGEAPRIVVMGPSGAGKSVVGAALAEALGMPFLDADSLHPESNVEKMAAGIPLTDGDRGPWLQLVGRALAESSDGLVVACSALRRSYRELIRAEAPTALFVELRVDPARLRQRVAGRTGHFMPAALVDSQLATLEPLGADESGVTVDNVGGIQDVVGRVLDALGLGR